MCTLIRCVACSYVFVVISVALLRALSRLLRPKLNTKKNQDFYTRLRIRVVWSDPYYAKVEPGTGLVLEKRTNPDLV